MRLGLCLVLKMKMKAEGVSASHPGSERPLILLALLPLDH